VYRSANADVCLRCDQFLLLKETLASRLLPVRAGRAEPATPALNLTCAECGRSPRAGETWRILFDGIGAAGRDLLPRLRVLLAPESDAVSLLGADQMVDVLGGFVQVELHPVNPAGEGVVPAA
jgi:hypothetical protein